GRRAPRIEPRSPRLATHRSGFRLRRNAFERSDTRLRSRWFPWRSPLEDGGWLEHQHAPNAQDAGHDDHKENARPRDSDALPHERDVASGELVLKDLEKGRAHSGADRESQGPDAKGLQQDHSRQSQVRDADGLQRSELLQVVNGEEIEGLPGD